MDAKTLIEVLRLATYEEITEIRRLLRLADCLDWHPMSPPYFPPPAQPPMPIPPSRPWPYTNPYYEPMSPLPVWFKGATCGHRQ